jgi:integrase/recombinase XerD
MSPPIIGCCRSDAGLHGSLPACCWHTQYSPRRIQQIIKETATDAQITKRVYPHLLRHSVATTLLERGMPIEQIQQFLGHSKLETTQIYAESSAEMIKASYQKALGE